MKITHHSLAGSSKETIRLAAIVPPRSGAFFQVAGKNKGTVSNGEKKHRAKEVMDA